MLNRFLGRRATRLALRSAAHHHVSPQAGAIRVQRVAFRPPFRPVRKFFTVVSGALVLTFFATDILDPFIFGEEEEGHVHNHGHGNNQKQIERNGENDGEEEDEEDEEEVEMEGFFVAFPFTTQVHQPPPYRGTDKEWLGYIEFSKDKALQAKLKDELARIAIKKIGADNKQSKLYMKGTRRIQMWLDFQYPPAPAPEYYHSGLLYATDGNLYWTARRADSKIAIDLDRIFYPQLVAKTLWSFATQSVTQTYNNFRAIYFPDTTRPQTPIIQINPLSSAPQPMRITIEDGDPATMTIVERVTRACLGHAIEVTEPVRRSYRDLGTAISRKWKGYRYPPPRGCVLLTGIIEVETPGAFLLIDVAAHWDPSERKFHYESMSMSSRGTLPKVQTPLR